MLADLGGNQTSRCLQDAFSLCAAWSGRVPEHAVGILAKFGSGPTEWLVTAQVRVGRAADAAGILVEERTRSGRNKIGNAFGFDIRIDGLAP